jgi:hypothetical protein
MESSRMNNRSLCREFLWSIPGRGSAADSSQREIIERPAVHGRLYLVPHHGKQTLEHPVARAKTAMLELIG